MRTSSIKSIVSALAIALVMALAVPTADARPARGKRAGRGETIFRAAISLLKKLGGVATNAGPSVPLGDEQSSDGTVSPNPTGEEKTAQ